MKKRDIITLAILGVIFAVLIIILFVVKSNNEKTNIGETEFKKLTLLTDETVFLSVEKNINKVYEYSKTNSKILSFIMKDETSIKKYNKHSFKAKQIYVISNSGLYKYYIKGVVYEEFIDSASKYVKEEYFILNYDIENSSYNLEIIDFDRYNNAYQEEYIFESVNSNEYNRFEYINLSSKTKALMYFNDFLNKIYSDTENAYELLSSDTKTNYFDSYEKFKNFVAKHNNISVVEFGIDGKRIGIKDNYNIEYIITTTNILEYKVTIIMTEE